MFCQEILNNENSGNNYQHLVILISELITDHTSILLSNNLIRVNAYTRKCWKYVSNPKHDALKYLFDLNILLQLKFSVPLTNVFMNFDHDFFFIHHSPSFSQKDQHQCFQTFFHYKKIPHCGLFEAGLMCFASISPVTLVLH